MINTVDAPGDITLGQCRIPAAKLQDTENYRRLRVSKRNAVTTFFTNRVTKALGMTLALMMTCQSAMASLAASTTPLYLSREQGCADHHGHQQ